MSFDIYVVHAGQAVRKRMYRRREIISYNTHAPCCNFRINIAQWLVGGYKQSGVKKQIVEVCLLLLCCECYLPAWRQLTELGTLLGMS